MRTGGVVAALVTALSTAGQAAAAPTAQTAQTTIATRPVSIGGPIDRGVDWPAINARTQRVQSAQAQHRLAGPDRIMAPDAGALVRQAVALVGPEPTGFSRLGFPSASVGDEAKRLGEAGNALAEALRQLSAAAASAQEQLGGLADRLEREATSATVRDRARGRAEEARRTLAGLQRLAREAAVALTARSGSWTERFAYYRMQLAGDGLPSRLARLANALEATAPVEPVLGAELSYVEGGGPAVPFPETRIVPAYASASTATGLEDTTQGREIEDDPELRAKALELRTAKAAYEFVKNQARLDWYAGNLKGTTQTLRDLRGNDVDLSGLLIALLRTQGTPARYVQGTIELPAWRMADLLGLLSQAESAQAQASLGGGLPPEAESKLFQALSAAGITVQPVIAAGRVRAVRWLHTWVEAYVPYADYRGAGRMQGARQWIPIDPVIPGGPRLVTTAPAEDVFSATGLTAEELQDAYLGAPGEDSPRQSIRFTVEARLAERRPGLAYEQLLRATSPVPESLPFLPGSLPFTVEAAHAEYAFLPEGEKHRVRIQVADGAGPVLDVTVPMHEVAGRRTLLGFEPATDDDRYAIDSAGGLYRVAAAAVAVKPVLSIAGQSRGQASRAIGLGAKLRWKFELLLPGGGSRPIENDLIAGNLVAIGIGSPVNRFDAARDATETFDSPAGRFLYGIAAAYANAWTEGEDELARLLQVAAIRPTANVVFVSNKLEVDEALGVVRRLVWKGLQVDADHRALQPVELLPGRGRDLLRLAGLEGSYQEALVLRSATGEDSVSAVTVLREARRQGVEVLRLRGAAPELGRLLTTPQVQREVLDQLTRGREVIIPAIDLSLRDWTGTGFIARDLVSGEGGYFLSGIISGGQTIVSPLSWTDQAVVEQLTSPTRPEPEHDVTKAARIIKVAGDFQRVTVGTTAPSPVRVLVTTIAGRPVYGVQVTFRAVGGSRPSLSGARVPGSGVPLVATTDQSGFAQAYVTADQVVLNGASVELANPQAGKPSNSLVGTNEVMAEFRGAASTVAIPFPFVLTGVPGPAARIELPCSLQGGPNGLCSRSYPIGIQLGEPLWARVVDLYGNWLANEQLTWTSDGPSGVFVDLSKIDAATTQVFDPTSPAQTTALLLRTAVDGLATTDFIPVASGRLTLHAATRTVNADYGIAAAEPVGERERYVLRLKVPLERRWGGIRGLRFPTPIAAEVLAWTGAASRPWVPISGDEGATPAVQVHMRVTDLSGQVDGTGQAIILRTETYRPPDVLPGLEADPRDNSTTVAFWPSYEVLGVQRHDWWATLTPRDGGPSFELQNALFLEASSRLVGIERFRLRPGFEEVPVGWFGTASTGDLAAVFKIDNPASHKLYARVVQVPRVAGEQLVSLPPPDIAPRHPNHPELIELLPELRTSLTLGILQGSHGGSLSLELEADDPTRPGTLVKLQASGLAIELLPSGDGLLAERAALQARIELLVRNHESTATPGPGQTSPSTATEEPVLRSAELTLRVAGEGSLVLSVGGFGGFTEVAGAKVAATPQGVASSATPLGTLQPPILTSSGALLFLVSPNLAADTVKARFVPDDGKPALEQQWPLSTRIIDAGPLPVGHTFVKDVSVVDGHLARQFVDFSLPGRGGGLTFSRAYTNRSGEAGPLGRGWTHTWRSWVTHVDHDGKNRYIVVGGEGTGQAFECTVQPCKNQRGFHGRLEPTASAVVYTAPNGTRYTYGRFEDGSEGKRFWLTSIVDLRGNTTSLEYGSDPDVLRVWEPGNRRALQFAYQSPPGAEGRQLASVEVMASPRGLKDAAELRPIDEEGLCLVFEYGDHHTLTGVTRRPTGCEASQTILRRDGYSYVVSDDPELYDNLERYTGPDGREVEYLWYGRDDAIEGADQYLLMGKKAERVKVVRELDTTGPAVETRFDFSLRPLQIALFDRVKPVYETRVTGPRAGVPPAVYRVDPYGATSLVERPVEPGKVAVRETLWDPVHIRPVLEKDSLGRQTALVYDGRGNLIERRVTTALPLDAPPTLEPVRLAGVEVAEIVERWAFDPDHGGETCHVDPEGRAATTSHFLGLPRTRTELATPLDAALVAGGDSCAALAARAAPSSRDRIVELGYCETATCIQPAEGSRGDLASTTERGRAADQGLKRVVIDAYDSLGYPRSSTADPAGAGLATTTVHDARGRLIEQTDSQGHRAVTRYDGLDRPRQVDRFGSAGGSPGSRRTLTYHPNGQLHTEVTEQLEGGAVLLSRTIELDGLGRPSTTTEDDRVSGKTHQTKVELDEAGNRRFVTDRRGVKTETVYDYGDRPRETWVAVADRALFEANGGDLTGFEGRRRIASAGFDLAGNRTWEEDLHGHRTDFTYDTLYRVVRQTLPQTVDESGQAIRYQVSREHDRVGNKVLERDGNGHETRFTYDHANREIGVLDAVGRSVTREFDGTGALRTERTVVGSVEQLVRTLTYDGLGRPLDTTETWATPTGTRSRSASTRYDDPGRRVLQRDSRGVVTVTKLDALDRVVSTVADTADGALARSFTAAPAVAAETKYEYDALGHRRALVDPLGRRLDEDVDAFGRTFARRLPMGVTESTTFDGEGQVVERRDGRGVRWRTYRDPLGRVTEESVIEADASQVLARAGREAGELALKRSQYVDGAMPLVHDLDPRGNLTTRTLDALHREAKVVNAEGGSTESRYDAVNKRWVKDPRGYQAWLTYDAVNRPTGQEDRSPAGSVLYTLSTSFRDATREEEHRSRAGRTTITSRDGLGRTVRVERSGTGDDGIRAVAADLTEYDAAGNATAQTDANGHVTRFELDGLGRKVAETVAAGTSAAMRTSFTYDAAGNRVEVKGPRGAWAYDLHQDYDDLNRPVRSVDAEGHITTHAFDAAGNRLCELRPAGGDPVGAGGASGKSIEDLRGHACGKPASTGWTYDELGKLTGVTTAAGATTFVYDAARNLIAKQDANEHLTVFGYDIVNRRTDEWQQLDAHGRLTRRSEAALLQRSVLPDAALTTGALHWRAEYDLAGNVTKVTEPKGDVRVSTYGVLNRLATVTFTQHEKPTGLLVPISTATEYDGDGQVRLVTQQKVVWRTFFDAESTVSEEARSEYDGLGRLWRQHRYDGKVVEYAYDLKGNRSKVTDPDGVETSYAYDEADRLETVTTPRGAVGYTYWPDGLRKATGLPNGLSEGRCYDKAGQLTAIVTRAGAVGDTCPDTGGDRSRFRYAYDGNGNRQSQQEWRTDPGTQVLGAVEETTYGYDGLDRLVGVQYPGGKAELYRLDALGNRTGERELAGVSLSGAQLVSYEPPAGATVVRDVTSTFNRADWLLSLADQKDPTRDVTLGWTASGELLTKTTATVSRSLTWDGRGALVAVTDNGTEVGRYDYDADGLRVKRKTAAENVEYVLDEAHVLQEADAAIQEHPSYRRYHYGAEPVLVVDGGAGRFIGTDALGSPTDLTSTTGRVEAKRQYDAWGRYRNGTAPGTGEAKLGFTGHQFDPETGLIYARARYYDPEIGRFISRDTYEIPIEAAPHLHRFIYANDQPTVYADPSGHIVPLLVMGAVLIAAEVDFWHQQNVNRTASADEIWEKTSFGEVGLAGAAGGAAALTGVGAGAAAAAGATALGFGAVGTGITAGAVGGGVTAGLDALSQEAIDVAADRKVQVDWGRVGKSTAVGTILGGAVGGAAGKVSSELNALGDDLAEAATRGFQEGAAELAGSASNASRTALATVAEAVPGAVGGAAGRGVTQAVEAATRPGTGSVSSRHAAWASDLDQVNASLQRLGQRALRGLQGSEWRVAEQRFEKYAEMVERRLAANSSRYGVEVQPAALPGGTRVPNYIYMHRGGANSPLVTNSAGQPRLVPYPGSRRLDLGVVDTTSRGPLRRLVSGFDVSLNTAKPDIVDYYQEAFGDIPIFDIRSW